MGVLDENDFAQYHLSRLTETAPVHLRGVAELFVARLDDQELAALESALGKVTVDCTFG